MPFSLSALSQQLWEYLLGPVVLTNSNSTLSITPCVPHTETLLSPLKTSCLSLPDLQHPQRKQHQPYPHFMYSHPSSTVALRSLTSTFPHKYPRQAHHHHCSARVPTLRHNTVRIGTLGGISHSDKSTLEMHRLSKEKWTRLQEGLFTALTTWKKLRFHQDFPAISPYNNPFIPCRWADKFPHA